MLKKVLSLLGNISEPCIEQKSGNEFPIEQCDSIEFIMDGKFGNYCLIEKGDNSMLMHFGATHVREALCKCGVDKYHTLELNMIKISLLIKKTDCAATVSISFLPKD